VTAPDPADYSWWLASRAAGVVALVCIAVSVGIGLAMAGRVSGQPRLRQVMFGLHQQTALVGLVAIAVHGITLLGDHYLNPGLTGISVPFVIEHARVWTGLGVTGGWLAAILGLSYWMRHRIGPARWRKLHRATLLVYVLAVAHTLGSGTDAGETWMRMLLIATAAPILFLFIVRALPAPSVRRPRFRVIEKLRESAVITSFLFAPLDGRSLPRYAPGQFVSVRAKGKPIRNYSLSNAGDGRHYRISVKREGQGLVSRHLHDEVKVGDVVELSDPKGAFVLDEASTRAVALVSAGVGITPLLAMLESLALARSQREVWWVHTARSGEEHAFRNEVQRLIAHLANAHVHVRYTRPGPNDVSGRDYDAGGRLSAADLIELGIPADAEFYLCGPTAFLADLREGLDAAGAAHVQSESFGGGQPAAAPLASASAGAVDFARSGRQVAWDGGFTSLLDLAEASDIPANSSCRAGSCHECATRLLAGRVRYATEPMAAPADGQVLLCCAQPEGEVVLDL
jgi:ferredoxin-NADP reductase